MQAKERDYVQRALAALEGDESEERAAGYLRTLLNTPTDEL